MNRVPSRIFCCMWLGNFSKQQNPRGAPHIKTSVNMCQVPIVKFIILVNQYHPQFKYCCIVHCNTAIVAPVWPLPPLPGPLASRASPALHLRTEHPDLRASLTSGYRSRPGREGADSAVPRAERADQAGQKLELVCARDCEHMHTSFIPMQSLLPAMCKNITKV